MQKTVPVFFTADEGYVPFLSVALTSLISHTDTSGNTRYRIIIVGKGLSEESKTNLTNMATGNVDIELYPMDADYIDSVSDDKNMLRADYITMTIYFRLFIPEMFPDIDKAIYLDSDTVINTMTWGITWWQACMMYSCRQIKKQQIMLKMPLECRSGIILIQGCS